MAEDERGGRDEDRPDEASETGRIRSLDRVWEKLEKIEDAVERALHGGTARPAKSDDDRGGGAGRPERTLTRQETEQERRAEIREELGNLKKQEAAEKEQTALTDRVGKLEKVFEQKPTPIRPVEKFMKWHG
jgi:hypothetical protein